MPDVHNYDLATGEFLSASDARIDPIAGTPLVPLNATLLPPPSPVAGHVAVFENDAWSMAIDNRGAVFWLPDGERVEIDEIGTVVPDGASIDDPSLAPLSLPEVKADAMGQMVGWIDRLTYQLRAGIPRDEIASWPAKSAEARAFLAHGTAAPILQVEADLIGKTLTEVAETISARAALYETVVGAVAGIRRNTVAAIDAASDAEGVALALDEALATATAKATELGLVVAG